MKLKEQKTYNKEFKWSTHEAHPIKKIKKRIEYYNINKHLITYAKWSQ